MMASPASVGNAAGSIDSKAGASKTSGQAPMSTLPLTPPVSVPLKPPASTNSGGKCNGKGKQSVQPAGKGNVGKRRNDPAATDPGEKALPGKTGKRAKSAKQSAMGGKAQWALQLIERGLTPDQITATFEGTLYLFPLGLLYGLEGMYSTRLSECCSLWAGSSVHICSNKPL